MNSQISENAPKIKKESKNRIKVDFERTSLWKRIRMKYLTAHALGSAVWWIFRFVLLLGISFIILQPFLTKFASSFMARGDFVDVTIKLIPKNPTFDTYKTLIEQAGYFTALLNTALVSLVSALLQTCVCSLVGYGLAKYKFKGAKLIFALVILTMAIPHKTLQLSMSMKFQYFDLGIGGFGILEALGIKPINMLNTYWPLVLLSIGGLAFKNGLYIFMMRQFFMGVPDELEESAYIDGYGPMKTFFKIIVPISVPMMITIFLFAFSWQWTDNFYVNMFFNSSGPKLLDDIISVTSGFDTNYAAQELYESAIKNTSGLLILYPLIIVYLFCQKYLVQGIERSGIVG